MLLQLAQKKTLTLHCTVNLNEKGELLPPAAQAFAGFLWPDHQINFTSNFSKLERENTFIGNQRQLKRLSSTYFNEKNEVLSVSVANLNNLNHAPVVTPALNDASLLGTAIHEALQEASENPKSTKLQDKQYWNRRLKQLGNTDLKAADLVLEALQKTRIDQKGQWIFQKHLEARNELPLTTVCNEIFYRLVIDRTFIDEKGIRWIIDYKTAVPQNSDLNSFLKTQKALYQKKLSLYAQAFQSIEKRIIHLALYFPLCQGWISWEHTKAKSA